jgi:hypothetical protein
MNLKLTTLYQLLLGLERRHIAASHEAQNAERQDQAEQEFGTFSQPSRRPQLPSASDACALHRRRRDLGS